MSGRPIKRTLRGDGLDGLKRVGLPASAHQRHAEPPRTMSFPCRGKAMFFRPDVFSLDPALVGTLAARESVQEAIGSLARLSFNR